MYCDFAYFIAIMHFVANYVKFCKNAMLGGLPDLLEYYMWWGSVFRDPQIVLRNI